MARDDYGAINVISDEERDSLGIGGPKKPEDEKLFEEADYSRDRMEDWE